MKLVTFRKNDELLPIGGFLFDEETNVLVSAGVFKDEVRAEAWAQCLGDFLEEHDLTGILLEGDEEAAHALLTLGCQLYPDDWDTRVLN